MKSCVESALFRTAESLTARTSKSTSSILPSRASSDLYDILLENKNTKMKTPDAFTRHFPWVRQTIESVEINLTPTPLQLRATQP